MNILIGLGLLQYDEPILLPDLFKTGEIVNEFNKILEKREAVYLEVRPNPSKDYIIVEYSINNYDNSFIDIFDLSGKLYESRKISNPINQQVFDTRNWKPGLYFATINSNGKYIKSKKFMIVK